MILRLSTTTFKRLVASILLAAASVVGSQAATKTWSGAGGDNNWETAGNWGGSIPTSGDNMVFAGTTRLNPNAGSPWTIGSLTFSSGAGAFTLAGNDLTLGGGVTNNSTNTQTINNQITLSANQTWTAASGAITTTAYINANSKNLTIAGSSTVTVSGQLSNVSTLALTGSGNRSFGNQVSATTVNAGSSGTTNFSAQLSATNLNVTAGTNTFANVQASNGISVSGNASANFTGPVTGGSSGISITSSGNVNFAGSINSGSITLNGTGTTTISGSGSMSTGAVVVNTGTLVLDHSGSAMNGSLTVNNGGTVIFGANNQVPAWQTVTLNAGSTLLLGNTTQTFTNLVITGDSVIDFGTGGSTLNLTAYSNGVTVADGVTLTLLNWNSSVDVFTGSNPGTNVVHINYADNDGNVYATATWTGSGGGTSNITPGAPVPEPATYGVIFLGAGVVFVTLRRRFKK